MGAYGKLLFTIWNLWVLGCVSSCVLHVVPALRRLVANAALALLVTRTLKFAAKAAAAHV